MRKWILVGIGWFLILGALIAFPKIAKRFEVKIITVEKKVIETIEVEKIVEKEVFKGEKIIEKIVKVPVYKEECFKCPEYFRKGSMYHFDDNMSASGIIVTPFNP